MISCNGLLPINKVKVIRQSEYQEIRESPGDLVDLIPECFDIHPLITLDPDNRMRLPSDPDE